ncbi:MAG: TetR/AcrR family transcriptional regulator [Methanomicrobiaceae archaeon]|nr:TetR/AcrR family transcriptional regulator [Methanomicrobiaceae archaeon]
MPKVMPEYKEEVRKKIVHAAIELSDEEGLANVRMEDVAKKLGISRTTLYLYFKSREDLITQAHKTFRQGIAEVLSSAFEKESYEETFSAIFNDFIYPVNGFGTRSVIEMFAEAIRNDKINAAMEDNYLAMREMIAGIIEEQKGKGLISEEVDPIRVSEIIQSITLGIKMGSVVGLGRDEAEKIWKSAIKKLIFK